MTEQEGTGVSALACLLYSERRDFQTRVAGMLDERPDVRATTLVSRAEELGPKLELERPDLLVVDLCPEPARVFAALEAVDLSKSILLVAGPQADPQAALRALKLGAREYLAPLPTPTALHGALDRLQAERDHEPQTERLGTVLAVLGANGGAGSTVVATQLAAALYELGGQTLLVDLDMPHGDVAVHLDVPTTYTLGDTIGVEGMDLAYARTLLHTHPSGIRVLPSPDDIEAAEEVDAAHVEQLVRIVRPDFDWIVLDVSSSWNETAVAGLSLADEILLVTLLDVPTLNQARRRLDVLRRLGHSDEKIRPIVNRFSSSGRLGDRDLSRFLGRVPAGRIPNEYSTIAACVNRGEVLGQTAAQSNVHRAYLELARSAYAWRGVERPPAPQPVGLRHRLRNMLRIERARPARRAAHAEPQGERPFRVLAVTSNKGGVGKTTIANNLAVYFRALREDLPVLVLGMDDQRVTDRMFAIHDRTADETVASGMRSGSLASAIRLGQYGVHYVPASSEMGELKHEIRDPFYLDKVLRRTGWKGLVVIDTKSDFEILTQNAVVASDLTVAVVKDLVSLEEAERVYALLDELERPRERARVLLSLVDRRVKFQDGRCREILDVLLSECRTRGYPLFSSYVSRSPKIEALYTNPQGRAHSILHRADSSIISSQMRSLSEEVLAALGLLRPRAEGEAPRPQVRDPQSKVVNLDGWDWELPDWLEG